jgi:ferredoxin-NADP reductase
MLRRRVAATSDVPVRLLYSSRSFEDIIYRDELERLAASAAGVEVVHTLTRSQPPGWPGLSRRIDRAVLADVAWPAGDRPLAYVCGPTRFVETVAQGLLDLGYERGRIRTERFGPTGG